MWWGQSKYNCLTGCKQDFLTASQTPIKQEAEMKRLVSALMKPSDVAVVKCRGHCKEETEKARGDNAADLAAKKIDKNINIVWSWQRRQYMRFFPSIIKKN